MRLKLHGPASQPKPDGNDDDNNETERIQEHQVAVHGKSKNTRENKGKNISQPSNTVVLTINWDSENVNHTRSSLVDQTQFNESEPEDDNDNIEDTCCTAPHSTEDPAARGCNANENQQLSINEVIQIQRPKGTPGTEWTIAINMGLAGSTKKKEKYNLLKVSH